MKIRTKTFAVLIACALVMLAGCGAAQTVQEDKAVGTQKDRIRTKGEQKLMAQSTNSKKADLHSIISIALHQNTLI